MGLSGQKDKTFPIICRYPTFLSIIFNNLFPILQSRRYEQKCHRRLFYRLNKPTQFVWGGVNPRIHPLYQFCKSRVKIVVDFG